MASPAAQKKTSGQKPVFKKMATALLRRELAQSNTNIKSLSKKLATLAPKTNHLNLIERILGGGFSFAFFIKCTMALELDSVTIDVKELKIRAEKALTEDDSAQ